MTPRLCLACAAALLAACATPKAATGPDPKKGEEVPLEKMSIAQVQFDTAACALREVELPAVANTEALLAALLVARPMVSECLVDAKSRGSAPDTQVKLKLTVDDKAVTPAVASTNLTADGAACVEKVLSKLPLKPQPAGEKPATAELPVTHAAQSPQVRLGVNVASDVVGTIRLAQPSWCDCFADLGVNAPPTLVANLKLTPDKPLEVTMKAPVDPLAQKLSACLEAKLKAAALPPVLTEVQAPYAFLLVNSWAAAETPDADPALQFQQIEAIRGQRVADVVLAASHKANAAGAYDALVAKYKAKPNPTLIAGMREKCALVLAADDKWIQSLKTLAETDKRAHGLALGLQAKDASWASVEAGLARRLAETQAELPKADQVKAGDAAACPKMK